MKRLLALALVACSSPAAPRLMAPPPPPLRPMVEEAVVVKRVPSVLAYLDGSLSTIARKYVDPKRFDHRRMLAGALDAMELEVAEVITEIASDVVTVRVGGQQRTFAGDVDSLSELGIRLTEIIHYVQQHAETAAETIELATVNGMLRTLDPHTHLISAEEMREWDLGMSGKFAGIGVMLALRAGPAGAETLTAASVTDGAPAQRAGMRAGDFIVAIDGQATDAFTLDEAINRLRGAPATSVQVTIDRAGKRLELQITRAEITIPIVESRLLPGKVGYLFIERFGAETVVELRRAMEALRAKGARAWIVDLRQNPGGYLAQAVGAVDLFVDRGTIVSTVAGGRKHDVKEAKPGGIDTRSPVVVLIGPISASAAEVMAGALKQLDRAVLVGRTTFGKGSVQVLEDAARGAKLKITIAEYVAAHDISLQSVGIAPDIELVPAAIPAKLGETGRLRLVPEPPFREVDLGAHLTTTQKLDADKPAATLQYLVAEDDPEIEIARRLAAAIKPTRARSLRVLPKLVARARSEAEAAIIAAFGKLAIDWRAGEGAKLALAIDSALSATTGDLVTFTATATNAGARTAHRAFARATSDDPALDGLEIAFGAIAPGATARGTAVMRLPKGSASRTSSVHWQLGEATATTKVAITGIAFPQFALTAEITDGNDGIVQRGESLRIRARITNRGPARAPKVIATLRSLVAERVAVDRGRVEVGALDANQSKDAELVVTIKPSDLATNTVELAIADGDFGATVTQKLELVVGARAPRRELTPPKIAIGDVPLETTAETIRIAGTATDEQRVGDLYITTSNRAAKVEARKVFYVANKQTPALEFQAEVPLAHGANRIVVTAREDASSQTVKTIWVYRR